MWPYYLLIFFFFWQTRLPVINPYHLSDFLIGFVYLRELIILSWILYILYNYRKHLLSWLKLNSNYIFLVLIHVMLVALSIGSSVMPGVAILNTFRTVLLVVFSFLFGYFLYSKKRSFVKILYAWFIPFVVIGIISLGEMVLGHSLGLQFLGEWQFSLLMPGVATVRFGPIVILRPYATFPHPNVLAGVATIFLIWAVWFWWNNRESTLYRGWILLFGLLVLLSFSRSAWIGCLLCAIIILVQQRQRLLQYIRPGHLFLVLITVGLIVVPYSFRLFTLTEPSVSERLYLNEQAILLIQAYPLTGVGYGNFVAALWQHAPESYPLLLQPVHNIPLLAMAEIGVVGAIWFILTWVIIVYKLILVRHSLLSKPVMYCWVIVGWISLVDHYWWSLPIGQAVWWWLWGVSLAVIQLSKEEKSVIDTS